MDKLPTIVLMHIVKRHQERPTAKAYRARRRLDKAARIAQKELLSGDTVRLRKAAMLCQELERRGLEFEASN